MARKIMKFVAFLVTGILLIAGAVVLYVKTALPDVGPPPEITLDRSPANVERGKYLANHVMACTDCHSQRDWTQYSAPVIPHSVGMGGEVFSHEIGLPGRYVASNLTPANLGSWTDGEIFRAVTSGVGEGGRALFPIMPYMSFGKLDREDILSIIAYLRSLEPIEHVTEPSRSDFPMNLIVNTIPTEPQFSTRPHPSDQVAYGEYLVTAASCIDCHTRQEGGEFVGKPFSGGFKFPLPNNTTVVSANITPHETGIGSWTADQFVARFKQYQDTGYVSPVIADGDPQTVMPWVMFSGMREEDLRAIYAYLRTLEPVESRITNFGAPSSLPRNPVVRQEGR
ncbi:c-type cytochrome [Lewinella sp. JB7]|uniref:c-type cytochrome n=1 Tax=Lewinella sp. JB7 TaxID=2962887 RepID=UPI0020C9F3D3|nr:c-type cytochrome [Lewinella sp. JB7]MCP9236194.1 c-type cytochrome [Lewinella sp. JB7]